MLQGPVHKGTSAQKITQGDKNAVDGAYPQFVKLQKSLSKEITLLYLGDRPGHS